MSSPRTPQNRPIKASELERGLTLDQEKWRDQRRKRKLQKKELRLVRNFFIWANIAVAVAVLLMALVEHFSPSTHVVITDKVMIAAIAGVTVQSGAIMLAAFKGLFSGK